ncbi:MAG: ATP-binding protein [Pseudomonadota bacterium]
MDGVSTERSLNNGSSRLFKAQFQADNLSTRKVLGQITDAMMRDGLSGDLIGRVEIVLAELFNNIAEHAYQDRGEGEVRCAIEMRGNDLLVEVMDKGDPMPGGEVPEGKPPSMDVDFEDLPEGGFGWFIIRSQVDQLFHERLGLGNCTRLTFDIRRAGIG